MLYSIKKWEKNLERSRKINYLWNRKRGNGARSGELFVKFIEGIEEASVVQ